MSNDLPEIIRSQYDTVRFCWWLQDHPEVTQVQGWKVHRHDSGLVYRFGDDLRADVYEMYPERKAFNDWIRTYRAKYVRSV